MTSFRPAVDLDTPEWRPLLNLVDDLVYAATGGWTVLIDGRMVRSEGCQTTLDERALHERAETSARRQIAPVGLTIESKWAVVS